MVQNCIILIRQIFIFKMFNGLDFVLPAEIGISEHYFF